MNKKRILILIIALIMLIAVFAGNVYAADCTYYSKTISNTLFYNDYLTGTTGKGDHQWWNNFLRVEVTIYHLYGGSSEYGKSEGLTRNSVSKTIGTQTPSTVDYGKTSHYYDCVACDTWDYQHLYSYD